MIGKKIALLPFIMLLLLAASIAQENAPNVNDIRQVDFKNFTYARQGDQTEAKTTELRNGKNVSASGAESFLMRVAYGDLTGDGVEEAIVLLRGQNTRTSRTLDELFVYTLKDGRAVLLTNFAGGKRGDYVCSVNSQESNFKVEEERLIIDLAVALADDPQCDPTRFYTITLRWNGRQMMEVERSALKPLPEHRREVG